jgi:hypothetical protein
METRDVKRKTFMECLVFKIEELEQPYILNQAATYKQLFNVHSPCSAGSYGCEANYATVD